MPVGQRYYGLFNQAEMGAPAHSAYGQGLRAREAYASGLPHQTYLPGPFPFRDQIGTIVIPPYALHPVVHREGYAGIAPLDLQSQVRKPHPWEDRSRGRP